MIGPDSMMERGAPDGSRHVVRPEKKAHRIGRPLRVASGGALHYADELNSAHDAVREPPRKMRAPSSAGERVSSKIEARIRNDATTANNARRRIIALRRSH